MVVVIPFSVLPRGLGQHRGGRAEAQPACLSHQGEECASTSQPIQKYHSLGYKFLILFNLCIHFQ